MGEIPAFRSHVTTQASPRTILPAKFGCSKSKHPDVYAFTEAYPKYHHSHHMDRINWEWYPLYLPILIHTPLTPLLSSGTSEGPL